jgi:hypothetical protein
LHRRLLTSERSRKGGQGFHFGALPGGKRADELTLLALRAGDGASLVVDFAGLSQLCELSPQLGIGIFWCLFDG